MHLHARGLHFGEETFLHLGAAEPIEQDVRLHVMARPIGQSVDEHLADFSGPVDVRLEGDRGLGGFDRGQHGLIVFHI